MTLPELLEMLKQATGPSRVLDVQFGLAVDLQIEGMSTSLREYVGLCSVEDAARQAESYQSILRTGLPRYTASLDAIVSQIKSGLPNGDWRFGDEGFGPQGEAIWREEGASEASSEQGRGKTDVLALGVAFVSALIAISEKGAAHAEG